MSWWEFCLRYGTEIEALLAIALLIYAVSMTPRE